MTRRWLRGLRPRKVRTRLTLLYALLFLIAGCSLLAISYALLASRLPAPSTSAKAASASPRLLTLCKRTPPYATTRGRTTKRAEPLLDQCKRAFTAGAQTAAQGQRDRTLNSMLLASGLGLALITIFSGALGWIVAGRALAPVKRITEAARRVSELELTERLALTGPRDELKELADTFDHMLERLDRAFDSQRRFVANAAHELRTPLTAMRTSIEVTLSKPSRTPEQLETMAVKIGRSLHHAQATVDALLELAVGEQASNNREPVDLASAARHALETASDTIKQHNLTIEAELQPAPAHGDPVLLERVIANLIDNAARHNTPGGWIRIHTGHTDDGSHVEIDNSGLPVDPQIIPTLFEPFARAEQRLNPQNGVGLGLSIANAIATAHGATLRATSRPAGGLEIAFTISDHHQ